MATDIKTYIMVLYYVVLAILLTLVLLAEGSSTASADTGYLIPPPVVHTMTTMSMELSGYVCEDVPCLTAAGVHAEVGIVAATSLTMGQWIEISGMGRYVVADRGPLRPDQIDIFFEQREDALQFGRQKRLVWLIGEQ